MAKSTTKRTSAAERKVLSMNANTEEGRLFALASVLLGRAEIAARMGKSYGTSRDIYTALGYNKNPTFDDYYARWERQDIAKRVVEAPVDATWRGKPQVVEEEGGEPTQFEQAWLDLERELDIFHFISRADKISGIGEYGILLLGFDDGDDLDKPVVSAKSLLYLHPYGQNTADVNTWTKDSKDPRFGLPDTYRINFSNADKTGITATNVHWSRVIHLAEGLYENNVYGTPRLRPVLNRLQDLDLISGGSAEMFWRGAFPGYGFKNDPEATANAQTLTDLQDEIEEYMHGLKRYLRLSNMSVESLAVQIADPSNHFDILVSLISSATGIPKRILTGSERGELASGQDKENWADRIEERRDDYAGPRILRPLIDQLIEVGVLPEVEKYDIVWPDAHSVSDEERAKVAETKSRALANYVNAVGADMVIPPSIFLRRFLDFTPEDVKEINEELEEMAKMEEQEAEPTVPGPPAPPVPPTPPGQQQVPQVAPGEEE